MKRSELATRKRVHKSQIGRYGQEDPTVAVSVPEGDYELFPEVIEEPGINGGRPYHAVAFVSGDSAFAVGLRKFRGFGYVDKEEVELVSQPKLGKSLVDFLATSPKVRVLGTQTHEVDLFGSTLTPTEKVKTNFPVWKLAEVSETSEKILPNETE